jgi:hypothetical protein
MIECKFIARDETCEMDIHFSVRCATELDSIRDAIIATWLREPATPVHGTTDETRPLEAIKKEN